MPTTHVKIEYTDDDLKKYDNLTLKELKDKLGELNNLEPGSVDLCLNIRGGVSTLTGIKKK